MGVRRNLRLLTEFALQTRYVGSSAVPLPLHSKKHPSKAGCFSERLRRGSTPSYVFCQGEVRFFYLQSSCSRPQSFFCNFWKPFIWWNEPFRLITLIVFQKCIKKLSHFSGNSDYGFSLPNATGCRHVIIFILQSRSVLWPHARPCGLNKKWP